MSIVPKPSGVSILCLVGFFCCSALAQSQQSKPAVEVVGLSIIKADPENEFGGSAVMGRSAGLEVYLRIRDDKAFFISIADEDEETQVAIQADKEEALVDESGSAGLGFMSDISEDGTTVTVPVSASQLPPAGTQKLHIKGAVALIAGKDPKTDSVQFQIADGTEVKLGAITVKVTDVEEDPFGESGWGFAFEGKQSPDSIREITFFDENGEEIEANPTGSSSFGFNNNMTYSQGYMLEGKSQRVTAKVSYFQSTEKVVVPIDLTVGLGLGG